jgi:hypothetical protein
MDRLEDRSVPCLSTLQFVHIYNRWTECSKTSLVATMVRHVERKALQIHNQYYIVIIKGTKNLLHSPYTQLSLYGIGRPPVWKTGDTHS